MQSFQSLSKPFLVLSMFLCFSVAAFAQSDLGKHFKEFRIVSADANAARSAIKAGRNIKFSGAEDIFVELEANDLRAPGYRVVDSVKGEDLKAKMAEVSTFAGRIAGESASNVRLSIVGGKFVGFLESKGERLFIESAARFSKSAKSNDYVIYRAEDVLNAKAPTCAAEMEKHASFAANSTARQSTQAALKVVEIATEADAEYVTTLGGAAQANAEILSIFNMIDGVFSEDLGLKVRISLQHTWSSPDGFDGSAADPLLRSFQTYWNTNFNYVDFPRDTAHLFTAKPNVLSQGYAFLYVICASPENSYGLSGYIDWAPAKFLVTAHELGHNFGAEHAEEAQSCAKTLMNSVISFDTAMSFCAFSKNQINTFTSANNSCLSNVRNTLFDYDGDAKTDVSVFRPSAGEWWVLKSGNSSVFGAAFGTSTDKPTPADFTGDGKTDVAFFRPSTGFWFVIRSEDNTFFGFPFGTNGDVPAVGDFDADGKADQAVFRNGTWFLNQSTQGFSAVPFGTTGDVPVAADYDGDGKTDVAIFRPAPGEWWILRSSNSTIFAAQFGSSTDKVVQGDYTGDGKADVAFFRPSTGFWFVLRSEDQSFFGFPFGASGDVPAPGDYDGDGKTDAAVFRSGTWFLNRSTQGFAAVPFGTAGDIPTPASFIP